jgi:Telomere regulation protein Stn1
MATKGLKGSNLTLTFYPAYCYKASPTYFAWVKLTAADVHNTLSTRRGYEGQDLYFYLNHPIQFVYLVGVVVSFEDFHKKRWLLIIDDSSGATIEVACAKPVKKDDKHAGVEPAKETAGPVGRELAEEQARADIIASIDVGSVIQVRGKIATFRDIRQIRLERIAIVPDTNAEMHFWEQRTKMKAEILSTPWKLSPDEQSRLLMAVEGHSTAERVQALKRQQRDAARRAREERHALMIARKYEKEEVKRAHAAEAARKAGELLMKDRAERMAMSAA